MVAGRQIEFALAVAIAEFEQLAGAVDAQPLDRVARPAAAVAVARQPALGRQHALATMRGNVALEIGLVAEQAEAVLDLPLDAGPGRVAELGLGRACAPGREQERDQPDNGSVMHGLRRNGWRHD